MSTAGSCSRSSPVEIAQDEAGIDSGKAPGRTSSSRPGSSSERGGLVSPGSGQSQHGSAEVVDRS